MSYFEGEVDADHAQELVVGFREMVVRQTEFGVAGGQKFDLVVFRGQMVDFIRNLFEKHTWIMDLTRRMKLFLDIN